MAKTEKEVQGDIISFIKGDPIYTEISGDVYRNGYRPVDSNLEDIVVIFTMGTTDQIESGVVTIHIYVPDIELGGVYVEDGARVQVLERKLQDFLDSMTCGKSCYKFSLQYTIKSEPVEKIGQHFIVAMMKYRYFANAE